MDPIKLNLLKTLEDYSKKALEYIKTDNVKQVHLSIIEALFNLNNYMGREILKTLPKQINDLHVLDENYKNEEIVQENQYEENLKLDHGFWVTRFYHSRDDKNSGNYFSLSVRVIPSNVVNIEAEINHARFLHPEKKKIVLIPPTSRKAIGEFYPLGQFYSAKLEIPYNNFYISITGMGSQSNEAALVNHASKIDFDAISKIVNGV